MMMPLQEPVRYYTKVDKWILVTALVLAGVFLFEIFYTAFTGGRWFILLPLLSPCLIILPVVFKTHYTLTPGGQLIIVSGFFKRTVPVEGITSVRRGRSFGCYGMSLDQLRLEYGKYHVVYISPKEKESFLADLRSLNPTMAVAENLTVA